MTNKSEWGLGQWQAYVERGESKEERKSRLLECPISMQDDVRRHVETVFAIRKYHNMKKR